MHKHANMILRYFVVCRDYTAHVVCRDYTAHKLVKILQVREIEMHVENVKNL